MRKAFVLGGCLGSAILLVGLVGAITGSVAVLGMTPVGIGVYLAVGIGLPQWLFYRETGSPIRLGLASFAAAGAAVVILVGLVRGSVHANWGPGFVVVLLYVVVGDLLGTAVRELRAGYRSSTASGE